MDYIKALQTRYSSKRMNSTKIDEKKTERILESIRLSASSYGLQPYKILIIQNELIKKEIAPLCYNQAQITECDAVILFAVFKSITPEYIEQYIQNSSQVRGIALEKLNAYKTVITENVEKLQATQKLYDWASKQTYLALGTALTACALEEIDSCPMEGFDKEKINDYFKLSELNLESTVILTIGNRDVEKDFNATLPKYRKVESELIIRKK